MTNSKMTYAIAFSAMLLCAASARADVLYDSPSSGFAAGSTLISGENPPGTPNEALDSFSLSKAEVITGASFDSWTVHNDTVASVDWLITDLAENTLAGGVAAPSSQFYAINLSRSDIDIDTFAIPDLHLGAGLYYFVLGYANSVSGRNVGWDETANSNSGWLGNQNSPFPNTFQILGQDPGVPEPASWVLMLIGVAGLGVALRARPRTLAGPALA